MDANSEEHTIWAQTECNMSNDPDVIDDCNYSAYHVVDQFCDAWGHCGSGYGNGVNYKKTVYEWKFAWSSNYPPGGGNPDGYFDPAPGKKASTAHIQGFIRTNDDEYLFAGSHSNRTDRAGTVFFININDNDELRLNSVYRTYGKKGDLERHPVGVQVLGDYVFTELKNRYLTLYNVENVKYDHDNQEQNEIFHDFLMKEGSSKVKNSEDLIDADIKFSGGAGIAMAKLNTGTYLLAIAQPGGRKKEPSDRYFYFFVLNGDLNKPGKMIKIYVGKVQNPFSEDTIDDFSGGWMENISIITEKVTGNIYLVQTSDLNGADADGYWGLSKLEWNSDGINLKWKYWAEQDREFSNCDHRSAATTWVNKNGDVFFHCHEYKEEPANPGLGFSFKINYPDYY